MIMRFAVAALALAAATPALATPCADEVDTLQRRLDSAGAASVTGTTPPGGTTSSNSPKALDTPPALTKSDAAVKPTASGVEEAKKLVAQARQQAMEIAIAPLRERVRAALAECGGEAGRLAAVDAVMAEVLAAQERRLLATLAPMLGRHFERLCAPGAEPSAEAPQPVDDAAAQPTAPAPSPEARRDWFRLDLQAVLLAELELRLQPVQGLLAALRQHSTRGGS